MFKYMFSVVLAVAFGASAFAGHGHCNVQQVQQVVSYVQPVRQQFVEVQYAQPVVQFQNVGHHHNNVQQVVVQRQRQNVQVQRVVVANNNHHNVQQQVVVQKVVNNQPRVQRSVTRTVVRSR